MMTAPHGLARTKRSCCFALFAAKTYPPSCVSPEQRKSPRRHCRFRTPIRKKMPGTSWSRQLRISARGIPSYSPFRSCPAANCAARRGLHIASAHRRAELGYWIGAPYWRKGFATEAASAALAFGFETLRLNRIYAHHFAGNTASQRVLEKIGMRHEGRSRRHIQKWDQFVDVENYGLLAEEFLGGDPSRRSDASRESK